MDDREKLRRFSDKALEMLAELTWPHTVCFDIPKTNCEAYYQVKSIGGDWQLIVGIAEKGSDVLTSNWLDHGQREEMCGYLASEEARRAAYASLLGLTAKYRG